MADEPAGRTSLGVLHEILTNLGDSNTYITVVDALEALLNVLGSGGIGQAVSDWLTAHPEATTTVQNGSITLLKLANDVKAAIDGKAASSDLQALADNLATLAQTVAEKADASDLDDKADIDGYYSQLTAGLAENLIGRGDAVPAEYLYRTAGGTADIEDGIATIDCIKGNTLVWNQIVPDSTSHKSGTAASNTWLYTSNFSMISGHKYLLSRSGTYPSYGNTCRVVSTTDSTVIYGTAPDVPNKQGIVFECTDTRDTYFAQAFVIANEAYDFYLNLFDLTLMFGAGNEPATVEEFEALFPMPYYPYYAPKLLPVDIRGIETVGFNQWDAQQNPFVNTNLDETPTNGSVSTSGLIRVFPNTDYEFSHSSIAGVQGQYVRFYDGLGNPLPKMENATSHAHLYGTGNFQFTTINDARYCRLMLYRSTGISAADVMASNPCLHLVWSGYRNGEYEEHWSAERPIDTSNYFPTGLKKVGDKADALYADHYDTVIGAVDLGTLTWTRYELELSGVSCFAFGTSSFTVPFAAGVTNFTCAIYNCSGTNRFALLSSDMTMAASNNTTTVTFYVRNDVYTDAVAFKAAMSGVILYYELATPTTTEIDPPLNLSYKVSDFGTERIIVDETEDAPQTAPVLMEVEYGINAIDTIRRLPTEYQSHKSMGQLTAALESSLGIDITETWDDDDQRYEYAIDGLEVGADKIADGSISIGKLAQGLVSSTRNINTVPIGRYWVDSTTGVNYERTGDTAVRYLAMSDKVPCDPNTAYVGSLGVYSDDMPVMRYACYDGDGVFIESQEFASRAPKVFVTPSNAAFMHVGFYKVSGIDITDGQYIQIERGAVAHEHIAPASPVDSVARENLSTIQDISQYDIQITETPGYFGPSGNIANPSSTQLEVYTQRIAVEELSKLEWSLLSPNKHAIWISYVTYDSDGSFISRTLPQASGYNGYGCGEVIDDFSGVSFIAFSYRTYGESTFALKATPSASAVMSTIDRLVFDSLKASNDSETAKSLSMPALFPLRFKPCYDHLFVNTSANSIVIPHESVYHVRLSRRLGFNTIEANVAATSDGVYIVNHLIGGKFGRFFHHADGETDISDISVADVTWNWVEQNVRYNSQIAKYRTRPCTLQEFLAECRQQEIVPFVYSSDANVLAIADSFMGVNNYIAYGASRANCPNGIIYHWVTRTSKEDILAYCDSVGAPFIYGMANPTAFTDAELRDIVDTLHAHGYWIGTSYADTNWHKYLALGFDANGTQGLMNRIAFGNVCNIDSIGGFGGYDVTNATETDGVLAFSADGTVTPHIADQPNGMYGVDFEVSFVGTMTISIGEIGARTYTSDGSLPVFVATPVINGNPKASIGFSSGTVVYDMTYKILSV